MMNEDWRRIEELFHEANELSPSERAEYLSRACGGDAHLRSEVEAYLSAYDANPEILNEAPYHLGLQLLLKSASSLALDGKQIGPYRILRPLGEGGMGVVYLAEDTRLNREVALKFLCQGLVDDSWARRQLKKEAQAVAKLDHPNICQVYGFEELDGHSFIVMQYVEGETLHSIAQKGTLLIEHVPKIGGQIAGALAEAHAHGIIHRDIKPNNIMVSANGHVKVLDFGLAKSAQQSLLNAEAGESQGSSQGHIPGTVRYMSPEQLRNEKLDFRSDVFSFGIVLYEMITGRNPFAKDSQADSITAILDPDPPAEAEGPKGLLQIARKCLVKDRERRYQSISEVLLDIEDYLQGKKKFRGHPIPSRLRARLALAGLLLLVIISAVLYYNLTKEQFLVVMPIINKSGDQAINYLGDGLTDTLIQGLSRLPRLKVKPRALAAGYKGEQIDPLEVGRSLDVQMVFISEITKRDDHPVLNFRLIRAKDGSLAWSGSRDINPAGLLSIHRELCNGIAEKSLFYLRDSERKSMVARQTQNPEAFQHYVQARHYWNNRNRENLYLAIEHFSKTLELDPEYLPAYAGLADCYAIRTTVAYDTMRTQDAMLIARDFAQRVLRRDYTSWEAHTSLGMVKLKYDWDLPGAEKEFKLAISLNSEYADAHYWYSLLLSLMERRIEAIEMAKRARELAPSSAQTEMNLGRAYFFDKQYERAADHFKKMREKSPTNEDAIYMLGLIFLQWGAYDDAIDILRPLHAKNPTDVAAPLGLAYAKSGRQSQARKILAELEEISRQDKNRVPSWEKAIIHMGLNEMEEAFRLFRQACDERFATFPFIKVEPMFEGLRSDSRYGDLLRCANSPPAPLLIGAKKSPQTD
jgi:serine/threonine protein kinase/tetratricopeptide (TPR) repeat protein